MTAVDVVEAPIASLSEHARIPIAFRVESVMDVSPSADGRGFALTERAVESAYVKDYDAVESPLEWPRRFDVSRWGLLHARPQGESSEAAARPAALVGVVVVAFGSGDVDLLEGRSDLAVLWDLRVEPSWRRRGVGSALVEAAQRWARARACRELSVETQDVNVPACRFYERSGFALVSAVRGAYARQPTEIQLLWRKAIAST